MDSEESGGRRREARLPATGKPPVQVRVSDPSGEIQVTGEVLDLSSSGLRLASTQPIPQGRQIELTLSAPEVGFSHVSLARVCWSAPAHDGWFVGLLLEDRLTSDTIELLAVKGAIERRRDMRQPISIAAKARTELGSQFEPVELVDFSAGGFCAVTNAPTATPGERIMVQIPSPGEEGVHRTVRAKVAWSAPLNGKHGIGCTFLSHHDYAQLQEVVKPGSRDVWRRQIKSYRATQWRGIACAATLLLAIYLIGIAWKQPWVIENMASRFVEPAKARFQTPGEETVPNRNSLDNPPSDEPSVSPHESDIPKAETLPHLRDYPLEPPTPKS